MFSGQRPGDRGPGDFGGHRDLPDAATLLPKAPQTLTIGRREAQRPSPWPALGFHPVACCADSLVDRQPLHLGGPGQDGQDDLGGRAVQGEPVADRHDLRAVSPKSPR